MLSIILVSLMGLCIIVMLMPAAKETTTRKVVANIENDWYDKHWPMGPPPSKETLIRLAIHESQAILRGRPDTRSRELLRCQMLRINKCMDQFLELNLGDIEANDNTWQLYTAMTARRYELSISLCK